MPNFFGLGNRGNVPLSSFGTGNLLNNSTMYKPNAAAGVGSLTGFGSSAPGPGGVPYGDWASKIKPSVPVNSTTGQALLNPQWGNLAQAPDKPWDFSGASGSIMSQRGHVVRDGELVPKVSAYGTPHAAQLQMAGLPSRADRRDAIRQNAINGVMQGVNAQLAPGLTSSYVPKPYDPAQAQMAFDQRLAGLTGQARADTLYGRYANDPAALGKLSPADLQSMLALGNQRVADLSRWITAGGGGADIPQEHQIYGGYIQNERDRLARIQQALDALSAPGA